MIDYGFTASCFDMLHSGHILMLREARNECDHLIVGLLCCSLVCRSAVSVLLRR